MSDCKHTSLYSIADGKFVMCRGCADMWSGAGNGAGSRARIITALENKIAECEFNGCERVATTYDEDDPDGNSFGIELACDEHAATLRHPREMEDAPMLRTFEEKWWKP